MHYVTTNEKWLLPLREWMRRARGVPSSGLWKSLIRVNMKFIALGRLSAMNCVALIYGGFGHDWMMAARSRFLIGLGMGVCWWNVLRVLRQWLNGNVPMMRLTVLNRTLWIARRWLSKSGWRLARMNRPSVSRSVNKPHISALRLPRRIGVTVINGMTTLKPLRICLNVPPPTMHHGMWLRRMIKIRHGLRC